MSRYLETAWEATVGYARYLWRDITEPTWHSYFYLLLAVSLAAWLWELARIGEGGWNGDQGPMMSALLRLAAIFGQTKMNPTCVFGHNDNEANRISFMHGTS